MVPLYPLYPRYILARNVDTAAAEVVPGATTGAGASGHLPALQSRGSMVPGHHLPAVTLAYNNQA